MFGKKIWSGYGYSSGFAYYAALQMAHIPTDIIFDENIQCGDLAKYEVLFMHDTTHLPKSVFDAVAKFAENGGTVVCGKPFSNKIKRAIDFDMTFPKRRKASYYHIKYKNGFTADQVYEETLKESSKIRRLILPKIKIYADCDSPSVFLNLLQADKVKYLFVVNDKRTFGDYAGKKYKAVMEQGLPQSVSISICEKKSVIYDILAHKRLNVSRKNGKTFVNINLDPAGGKVLAIYPEPLEKLEVTAPKTLAPGESADFAIRVLDATGQPAPGIQPLKIEITDPKGRASEFSGYYATANGTARIKFIPATNDIRGKLRFKATEICSGSTTSLSFEF